MLKNDPRPRSRALRRASAGLLCSAALVCAALVEGAPPKNGIPHPTLDAMGRAYGALSSLEQHSTHTVEIESGGRKSRNTVEVRFLYQKPNLFRYEVRDTGGGDPGGGDTEGGVPEGGVTVASDGNRLRIYSQSLRQYTESPAPTNVREARHTMGDWGRTYMDAFAFLQGIDPYQEVTLARRLGSAKLGGVPVHVLELHGVPRHYQMPNSTTRLYINQENQLLLKSITEASRGDVPATPFPGAGPGRLSVRMTKTHRIVRVNQPIGAARFAFSPPAGAQKVARLPR